MLQANYPYKQPGILPVQGEVMKVLAVVALSVLTVGCAGLSGPYVGIPCDGDEMLQHYECADGQRQWQSGC